MQNERGQYGWNGLSVRKTWKGVRKIEPRYLAWNIPHELILHSMSKKYIAHRFKGKD